MKIKLVFHDWVRGGKSIYDTEEGIELSLGDFHSGTTFDGEIILDASNEREIKEAAKTRAFPAFSVIIYDTD